MAIAAAILLTIRHLDLRDARPIGSNRPVHGCARHDRGHRPGSGERAKAVPAHPSLHHHQSWIHLPAWIVRTSTAQSVTSGGRSRTLRRMIVVARVSSKSRPVPSRCRQRLWHASLLRAL